MEHKEQKRYCQFVEINDTRDFKLIFQEEGQEAYTKEWPSILTIKYLSPLLEIWAYSKKNGSSIFIQKLTRFFAKMRIIFSESKILGILKTEFYETYTLEYFF